jgi:hypothetical protein
MSAAIRRLEAMGTHLSHVVPGMHEPESCWKCAVESGLAELRNNELPPETVSAIREWLDGYTVELSDDAIVKLADAKGRPFAHVTAGFLRSLIGETGIEEFTAPKLGACFEHSVANCHVCTSPARLSGTAA